MSSPDEDSAPPQGPADASDQTARRRLSTVFGWTAGGALGLLINFAVARAIGSGYPITISTAVSFIVGAFGGMALSDRLGPRGFRPLGIAAGVLLAVLITGLVTAAFAS